MNDNQMNRLINTKQQLKSQKSQPSQRQHQSSSSLEESKGSHQRRPGEDHCAEYGDFNYVCFKIEKLEFFATSENFAKHSQYFNKVYREQIVEWEAQEIQDEDASHLNPQIVIRLSRHTLPSVLVLCIKFIDERFIFDASTMDLQTLYQVAQVADELKMRQLEQELLNKVIIQMLNKLNVIDFLNVAHSKVENKRKQYRSELLPAEEQDESESSSEECSSSSEDEDAAKRRRRRRRRRNRRRNQEGEDGSSGSNSDSESDSSENSNSSGSSCGDISEEDRDSSSSEERRLRKQEKKNRKQKKKREIKMVQVDLPFDENEIIDELKDSQQNWEDFRSYCVSLAACNLQYIMHVRKEELVKRVNPDIVDMIINQNMEFYRGNPNIDNRSLIDLLMKVRGIHSVFELLRIEKEKIMKEEKERRAKLLTQAPSSEPLLVWSVSNLTNYFYKQSDSIHIQGAHWRLALSFFRKQSTCLKVDIKIMNSPFDIKQSKEYYKKHEYGVPSNLDVKKLDPMAQFEVEEVDVENQQQRVNQLNAAAANFTNHAFVTFIASVDIYDGTHHQDPKIYSMICSQKSPVQLLGIENFDISKVEYDTINVSLQFQIKEMHAQLLLFISKNFTYLMQEPEIRLLTKEDLKLILKHKHLNVTQEDEVIKGVCLWLEGQSIMIRNKQYANMAPKSLNPYGDAFLMLEEDKRDSDGDLPKFSNTDLIADLNEVLINVNWDYVSLPCFLDLLRNEPMFRKCQAFQQAIKNQFFVRMYRDSQEAIEAARNQFNNEPRFSYKFNTSQRNLYPTEGDLAFQNREPIFAEPGTKSQFQLLYPIQIYPDFMQHLIDCMINPVDIVQNWNNSNAILENAAISSPSALPKRSVDEILKNQKESKRRHLKQQLIKKQLEMQQIQEQLDAVEILDKLNDISQLDDRIQRAKADFRLRISQDHSQENQLEPSGRRHLNQIEQDENPPKSQRSDNNSLGGRRQIMKNQHHSGGINSESDDSSQVKPLGDEDSKSSEVEMFKVDRQGQQHKRRLSEVAAQQQKQNEQQQRMKNDQDEEDKRLQREWQQLDEPQSEELKESCTSQSSDSQSSFEDPASKDSPNMNKISPNMESANGNSVMDYNQLKANRCGWSEAQSNQPNSDQCESDDNKDSGSVSDSYKSESKNLDKQGLSAVDHMRAMRQQELINNDPDSSKNRSVDDNVCPRVYVRPRHTMQMSVEGESQIRFNKSIDIENLGENENERNIPLSEDDLNDGQIQNMNHVQRRALAPMNNQQCNFDSAQSQQPNFQEHGKGFGFDLESKASSYEEKEIQTDELALVQEEKPKTTEDTCAQTELDIAFMAYLLEQMTQTNQIEAQLVEAQFKLKALQNIQKQSAETQTDFQAVMINSAVECKILNPTTRINVIQNDVFQLEILPSASRLTGLKSQSQDNLNNPDSSFFESGNSVSSDSQKQHSIKKIDINELDEDSVSNSEISNGTINIEQEEVKITAPNEELKDSITVTLSSHQSFQTPSACKQAIHTVDDLLNGQSKIKPLTTDIFANVGSDLKSIQSSSGQGYAGAFTQQRSIEHGSIHTLNNQMSARLSPQMQKENHPILKQRDFIILPSEESEKEQIEPENGDQFYGLGHTGGISQENAIFSNRVIQNSSCIVDDDDEVSVLPDIVVDPLQNFLQNHNTLFPQTTKVKAQKSLIVARPKTMISRNNARSSVQSSGRGTAFESTKTPKSRKQTTISQAFKRPNIVTKPYSKPEKFVPSMAKYSKSLQKDLNERDGGGRRQFGDRCKSAKAGALGAKNNLAYTSNNNEQLKTVRKRQIQIQSNGNHENQINITNRQSTFGQKPSKNNTVAHQTYGSTAQQNISYNPLSKFLNKHRDVLPQPLLQANNKRHSKQQQSQQMQLLQSQKTAVSNKNKAKAKKPRQQKIELKIVTETNQNETSQSYNEQQSYQNNRSSSSSPLVGLKINVKNGHYFQNEEVVEQPDSAPLQTKIRMSPKRDRSQSNNNFVTSRLSNMMQIQDYNCIKPLQMKLSKNLREKTFSDQLSDVDVLSHSDKDYDDNYEELKINDTGFKKRRPIALESQNSQQHYSANPFINIEKIISENLDKDQYHENQKTPLSLTVKSTSQYHNKSGLGMQSSQNSKIQVAQGDLFSNRDEGLACFNILDHLKQNSLSKRKSSGLMASPPNNKKSLIDLEQLREEHIQKTNSKQHQYGALNRGTH